jgi:hypothetical protein
MTAELFPPEALDTLTAEAVTAGALALIHVDAPSRFILCAGAGGYSSTRLFETEGIFLTADEQSPEAVMENMTGINNLAGQIDYRSGYQQSEKFLQKALEYLDRC